ncbi:hypothetical protein ACQ0QQ_12330 [Lysinibacillus sphaericus]
MNNQFLYRRRPYGGIGRRPFYGGGFFGAPFVGGVLGGLLGSALLSQGSYPYYQQPYGYGYGYPGYYPYY